MKRMIVIGLLGFLACIVFAGPEYKAEEVREFAQQDIKYISDVLEDFLSAGNAFPVQQGPLSETSALYKALVPKFAAPAGFHLKDLWGLPYQIYLGKAVTLYGFMDCGPEDLLVASFGKDGLADAWQYDPAVPEAGFYPYHTTDPDLDIVAFDGEIIRGPKMAEIEELRIAAMKDIFYLSESLTAYSMDGNGYPLQKGEFSADGALYKQLVAKYGTPGGVPTVDPWGNAYYVYLGDAIQGVYGIQDNGPDDCLVISFGADGKPDDWRYDPDTSDGMYPYDSPEVNNDIAWYSGVLIRGPEEETGAKLGAPWRTAKTR